MKANILVKQDGTWLSVDIPGGKRYCHRLETFAEKSRSGILAKMCDEIRLASNNPVEPTASSAEDEAEYWFDKDPRHDGETI